jgi:hypothetical protein
MLPSGCCPECGFDLSEPDSRKVLLTITRASRSFATPSRGNGDLAVSVVADGFRSDRWSRIEHIVHVADALTAARRRVLRMAVGDCRAHLPLIELPHEIPHGVELATALEQLDAAAKSLVALALELPITVRSRTDIHRTLTRAAHEVIHHSQLVADAPSAFTITGDATATW